MIEWNQWEYFLVSDDLSLANPTGESPEFWQDGIRSVEATVETLLSLNLSTLVNMPLRMLRRAYAMESSADVIATDSLGRIHLFELKKGSVSDQAAQQLEQYLLKHVFSDPDGFLESAEQTGRRQTSTFQLARDILGVKANVRVGTVGYKTIVHELGPDHGALLRSDGRTLSRYRYQRLAESEHLVLLHAALDERCRKRGLGPLPPLELIERDASDRSRSLRGQLGKSQGPLQARRRLVIWLAGASISRSALERVRLWRREGVDARVLRITARNDGTSWVVATQREMAPYRDAAESEILRLAEDSRRKPATVKLSFYSEMSPSTNKSRGGGLLAEPVVDIAETS